MISRSSVHIAVIGCFLALSALCLNGCAPEEINQSGAGVPVTPGGGTGEPANIAVTFAAVGTTIPAITSIASGSAVNVNALVTDAANNPMPGEVVTFALSNASAGSFGATPATATTDALGIATIQFDASAVDLVVTFSATYTDGAGTTCNGTGTLTIGNPPPPTPASLTVTINPSIVNILGSATVTISALDSSGNAAYSTPLVVSITTGTALGSFDAASDVDTLNVTTDATGQATATFYAGGSSGTVTITVTATAATPDIIKNASLSITSQPSSVSVSASPTTITTGGTANISADVRNALNNAVPDGTAVSFSITAGPAGAGTLAATGSTVNGIASVTFTASSVPGTIVIQASAGTSPNVVTGTTQLTINASATSSIEFVSANPNVIGIVGSGVQDNSLVTFVVKDSNGTPKPNVTVDFQLFGPTGSYIGSTSGSTTDQGSTNANGQVTTILHSGAVAGPARIVATVNGTAISTSSGNISIGGGVPSATQMTAAVSKFNVAGWGIAGATDTITVYLADRFGNYNVLQGTSVSFAADAGAVDTSNVTDATGITSVTFRTQSPWPADVPPSGLSYLYGGRTYNPEDGYVSLVAMTTGEETFFDANANGVYDGLDTFTDLGEPYLDQNKNGSWNSGDLFFDWPSTGPNPVPGAVAGTYQSGNGQWDPKIPIWKKATIVLTGQPDTTSTAEYSAGKRTSRIECAGGSYCSGVFGNVTIPYGAFQTFDVYVSDINMNTLVSGSQINIGLSTGSKGTLIAPTMPITLPDVFSTGPSIIRVTLANQITETTNQYAYLQCEVTWGGSKYLFIYPGTITLSTPPPPAGPAMSAPTAGGTGVINLSWSAVSGATSYKVYAADTSPVSKTSYDSVFPNLTATSYAFTGNPGTTYYFVVTAVNAYGESVESNEVSLAAPL
jgi:hypothetical protein